MEQEKLINKAICELQHLIDKYLLNETVVKQKTKEHLLTLETSPQTKSEMIFEVEKVLLAMVHLKIKNGLKRSEMSKHLELMKDTSPYLGYANELSVDLVDLYNENVVSKPSKHPDWISNLMIRVNCIARRWRDKFSKNSSIRRFFARIAERTIQFVPPKLIMDEIRTKQAKKL